LTARFNQREDPLPSASSPSSSFSTFKTKGGAAAATDGELAATFGSCSLIISENNPGIAEQERDIKSPPPQTTEVQRNRPFAGSTSNQDSEPKIEQANPKANPSSHRLPKQQSSKGVASMMLACSSIDETLHPIVIDAINCSGGEQDNDELFDTGVDLYDQGRHGISIPRRG
jgi:hypothetical protein